MARTIILFLAANPSGTNADALARECAAIETELRIATQRDDFEFRSAWAVSVDSLMQQLNGVQPDIIHFSGDGGTTGLVFVGDNGQPHPVSAGALTGMIRTAAPTARLAVLNACYSEAQADALRDVVGCAIGMTGVIYNEAAHAFAIGFYRALFHGRSVRNAYDQAVATLAAKGLTDQAQPRCLVRSGVEATALRFDDQRRATPWLTTSEPGYEAPPSDASPPHRAREPSATGTSASRAQADVVILTAIELEYAAVKLVEAGAATGSRWVEKPRAGALVAERTFIGRDGRHLRVAVARAADMGLGSALATLVPLVDALRPSCIAMCGVCAGRPGKTALGDVVVGERLYDYDAGKQRQDGFAADVRTYSLRSDWKIAAEQFDPKARFGREPWWQRRPVPYEWQENWVLAHLLAGVDPAVQPDREVRCPQWSVVIENLWSARHVKRGTRSLTKKGQQRAKGLAIQYQQLPDLSPGGTFMPFRLHVAPIGSGSAVREDETVWGFVTPHMRKALGLEMEASALAHIVRARAHRDPIDAVVMKGVMDFANDGRDDHFKDYAARASAECLIAFLRDQLDGRAAVADSVEAERVDLPRDGITPPVPEAAAAAAPAPPAPAPPASASSPLPLVSSAPDFRFEVALSFAGDNKRDKVRAVATILRDRLGSGRVFFDEWFEAELAGHDAQVVLQNIYRKATRLVVTCVCKRYAEKPWTQDEWRAIQAFERTLRDAGSENVRRMRFLPLRFGDGEVDGLFDTAIVPDVRDRDPKAIAELILKRLRLARGKVPRRSRTSVRGTTTSDKHAPPDAVSTSPPRPRSVDVLLAQVKQRIEDILKPCPALRVLLAGKMKCDGKDVVDKLVTLPGTVVSEHVLRLTLDELSSASRADREAITAVLLTVLPYVSDLQEAVADCCAGQVGSRDVFALRYRTATIAEAVVAGWVGRECSFELVDKEPRGVGAISLPATAQTALFASPTHLREGVVAELESRLGTTGTTLDEKTIDIESGLKREADLGPLLNKSRAQAGVPVNPVRYYLVFRDLDHKQPNAMWQMAVEALHAADALPSLVLVRLNGQHRPDETALNRNLVDLLTRRS